MSGFGNKGEERVQDDFEGPSLHDWIRENVIH